MRPKMVRGRQAAHGRTARPFKPAVYGAVEEAGAAAPRSVSRSAAPWRVSPVEKATLLLLVSAVVTARYQLWAGISWGELIYFVAAGLAASALIARSERVLVPGYLSTSVAFVVVVAASGFYNLLMSSTMVHLAMLAAVIRLLLFIGASLPLWTLCHQLGADTVWRVVRYLAVGHAAVGLALFLIWGVFGGNYATQEAFGTAQSKNPPGVAISAADSAARARGLMAEPAAYGAFQAFGLFSFVPSLRRRLWQRLFVIGSIIVSLSLVAFLLGLLALVASFGYRKGWGSEASVKRIVGLRGGRSVWALLVTFVFVTLISPAGGLWRSNTVERVQEVIVGEDQSGESRLVLSWTSAGAGAQSSPFFGSGLGNLGEVLFESRPELLAQGLSREHFSWNTFALVLGSTGFVGLVVWLRVAYRLHREMAVGFMFLMVWWFANSSILEPTFWFMSLILSSTFPGNGVAVRMSRCRGSLPSERRRL